MVHKAPDIVPGPPPCIAFVTGGLPLGGSTTLQRYVLKALMQKGAPVHLFAFSWKRLLKEEFEHDDIPGSRFDDRSLIYEGVKSAL